MQMGSITMRVNGSICVTFSETEVKDTIALTTSDPTYLGAAASTDMENVRLATFTARPACC